MIKKKPVHLSLWLFGAIIFAPTGFANLYGVFQSDYVHEEVVLDSSRPALDPTVSAPLIEKYILAINPDRDHEHRDDLSTKELAHRIAGVSYCFSIDPFVYTSLIRKESITYNQYAKSPTGAVGFTQFTSIAMKEVNDQLGFRGNKYAQTSAINYFTDIVTGSCLEKFGGFKTMGTQYKPLWEMVESKKATAMVKLLSTNPEYALVYGAILMKVNYSLVQSGFKSGCFQYPNRNPVSKKDKIKEVMMMYNGDGCSTQKKYQSDIMDKYYPAITGVKAF